MGLDFCSLYVLIRNDAQSIYSFRAATVRNILEPEFPIIYMTGAAARRWASHGVPNSILVEKPFAPAQLVTAVLQKPFLIEHFADMINRAINDKPKGQ